MKRFFTITLAILMILSLTACSSNTSSPGAPTSSAPLASPADSRSSEAAPADAPDYPTSTITIVVPYAAGGAMDNTARLFAKYAEKICNQNIIISNVTGGSGSVGAADVLNSKADGYKVLIFDPGPGFVATNDNPVPFDTMKDFAFVGRQTSDVRNLVVRRDDERFPTPEAFVQYVKDHPGEINVSTAGANTDASIALELIKQNSGLDMVTVAFAGASEAKSNLLGGHVDAASLSIGDSIPMLADNQIMIVGICAAERSELIPDAPTFKELGVDVEWVTSRGYAFKAGTDEHIVEYFEDLLRQVSENEEYAKELLNLGCPVDFMGRKEYTEFSAANFETIKSIMD